MMHWRKNYYYIQLFKARNLLWFYQDLTYKKNLGNIDQMRDLMLKWEIKMLKMLLWWVPTYKILFVYAFDMQKQKSLRWIPSVNLTIEKEDFVKVECKVEKDADEDSSSFVFSISINWGWYTAHATLFK